MTPSRRLRALAVALRALPGAARAEDGGGCTLRSGNATHEIDVAGTTRRYHVAVGSAASTSAAAPLLLL